MTVMPVDEDDASPAGPPPGFVSALVAELPALRRTVACVVAHPRLRDDVVQETLVRACRSWRSFDPDRPMGTWLRRLAVVSVAELDRADRRAAHARAGSQADASAPGSDDHVVSLDRRREVRAALGTLTPRDRTLLWRRDVDELPYEVLASLAGGNTVGLRQAVSRARHRFRVAYLAVVDTGRGCLVALAAVVGRLRRRVADRADAACERFLSLASASAAVVVATVAAGVPTAVVLVRAATEGAGAAASAGSPVAGADPLPPAAGTASTPPPAPPAPRPRPLEAAPAAPAPDPPAALRAGPAGAQGGVGFAQPTPANDAIWYQGVEVRCDRSTLLASTCAVLRATPAGDGVEVTVPRGPPTDDDRTG